MKTIVLIDNDQVELEHLLSIFRNWRQKDISILTAREEDAAIDIISSRQVDLVICNLTQSTGEDPNTISRLTTAFPFIPCIALADSGSDISAKAAQMGISRSLERPIDTATLLDQASELLDLSSNGTVKGIPIHSFLQMLESEGKTCTLLIHGKAETGILFIRDGGLIGAELANLRNEDAVHQLLTWEESVIEVRYLNDSHRQEMNTPLITLIMEAFRLKDERERKQLKMQAVEKQDKQQEKVRSPQR